MESLNIRFIFFSIVLLLVNADLKYLKETKGYTDCEIKCREEKSCVAWTSLLLTQNKSTICHLESVKMQQLRLVYPDLFRSKRQPGVFSETGNIRYSHISTQHLIKDPIPLDGTSQINIPQHFIKGCNYTISLWAWIWRTNNQRENDDTGIFSTRSLHWLPNDQNHDPLLPSIVFNLRGGNNDKLFFSVALDPGDESYQGMWLEDTFPYHKWVHLTLVVRFDQVEAWIDGEMVKSAVFKLSQNNSKISSCPYSTKIFKDIDFLEGKNFKNNSILQVGGIKGKKSMTGMIQDFIVFRNMALNAEEISALMHHLLPKKYPTLEKLIEHYQIDNLVQICLPRWENNYYIQKLWGLCPTVVCGPICINSDKKQVVVRGDDRFDDNTSYGSDKCTVEDFYKGNQNHNHNHNQIENFSIFPNSSFIFYPEKNLNIKGLSKNESNSSSLFEWLESFIDNHLPDDLLLNIHTHTNLSHTNNNNNQTNKKLQMIDELYQASMLWFHGRSSDYPKTSGLSLDVWFSLTREAVQSALMLGLWLIDDVSSPEDDHDIHWNFRYSNNRSQPFRLALANLLQFDKTTELDLSGLDNEILGINISNILGVDLKNIFESKKKEKKDDFDIFLATFIQVYKHQNCSQIKVLQNVCRYIDLGGAIFSGDIKEIEELFDSGLVSLNDFKDIIPADLNFKIYRNFLNQPFIRMMDDNDDHEQNTNLRFFNFLDLIIPLSKPENRKAEHLALNSLYFPIAQYVTSHWGLVDSGVRFYEPIRVSNQERGELIDFFGEEGDLQQREEAEAYLGNSDAMIWLAKRFFWGYGGVEANAEAARYWFERAAEANNAEGLYNLGVFYSNGFAGYPMNYSLAVKYFNMSALSSEPFPMALEAMGNYHLSSGPDQNYSQAKLLFQRASELNSAEGHFSLGLMLQEGKGGPVDIPRSIIHISEAAYLGNTRAINFLAHAFWDEESWLASYLNNYPHLQSKEATPSVEHQHQHEHQHEHLQWVYNFSLSLNTIYFPKQSVNLPSPISMSNKFSLYFFRYLSELTAKPNDLLDLALGSFVSGNYWDSLRFYDEASALGIKIAQENSAILYDMLMKKECSKFNSLSISELIVSFLDNLVNVKTVPIESNYENDCIDYFKRMLHRRYIQLIHSNDPVASRNLANLFKHDHSFSGLLYSKAASLGDVESIINLGWMFVNNKSIPQNLTMAKLLFQAGNLLESETIGISLETHTRGLAPYLALLYIKIIEYTEAISKYKMTQNTISIISRFLNWVFIIVNKFSQSCLNILDYGQIELIFIYLTAFTFILSSVLRYYII